MVSAKMALAFAALLPSVLASGMSYNHFSKRNYQPHYPVCPYTFDDFLYVGCYNDPSGTTLRFNPGINGPGMTIEKCWSACKNNGFRYAGLEYYGQCSCGATIAGTPFVDTGAAHQGCSYACNGNPNQICGGSKAVSVYIDPTYPVKTPDELSTAGAEYTALGCFSEVDGRTLTDDQPDINGLTMTVELCLNQCGKQGYAYAGVEYGQECWCAGKLAPNTVALDVSKCNLPCKGNLDQTCGGRSTIYIYYNKELDTTEPCAPPPTSSTTTTTTTTTMGPTPTTTTTTTESTTTTTESTTTTTESTTTTTESTTTTTESTTTTTESTTTTTESTTTTTESTTTTTESTTTTTESTTTTTESTTTTTESTTTTTEPTTTTTTTTTTTPSTTTTTTTTTTPSTTTTTTTTTTSRPPTTTTTTTKSTTTYCPPTTTTTTKSTTTYCPPTTTTTTKKSTTTSYCPTTTKPSTTTTTTTTKTTTTSCRTVCGGYCAPPLPTFTDKPSCKNTAAKCWEQVEACVKSYGYSDAGVFTCQQLAYGCAVYSKYCDVKCNGWWCNKKDCDGWNGYYPPPPKPTYTPTPTKSCSPPTYTPTPTNNVCVTPTAYKTPVGGYGAPVVSCNDDKSDYNMGNCWKVYSSHKSSECPSFSRFSISNACIVACNIQYENCRVQYGGSTNKPKMFKHRRLQKKTETDVEKRTWGWGSPWAWPWVQGNSYETYNTACEKCKKQRDACILANQYVDGSKYCKKYGYFY